MTSSSSSSSDALNEISSITVEFPELVNKMSKFLNEKKIKVIDEIFLIYANALVGHVLSLSYHICRDLHRVRSYLKSYTSFTEDIYTSTPEEFNLTQEEFYPMIEYFMWYHGLSGCEYPSVKYVTCIFIDGLLRGYIRNGNTIPYRLAKKHNEICVPLGIEIIETNELHDVPDEDKSDDSHSDNREDNQENTNKRTVDMLGNSSSEKQANYEDDGYDYEDFRQPDDSSQQGSVSTGHASSATASSVIKSPVTSVMNKPVRGKRTQLKRAKSLPAPPDLYTYYKNDAKSHIDSFTPVLVLADLDVPAKEILKVTNKMQGVYKFQMENLKSVQTTSVENYNVFSTKKTDMRRLLLENLKTSSPYKAAVEIVFTNDDKDAIFVPLYTAPTNLSYYVKLNIRFTSKSDIPVNTLPYGVRLAKYFYDRTDAKTGPYVDGVALMLCSAYYSHKILGNLDSMLTVKKQLNELCYRVYRSSILEFDIQPFTLSNPTLKKTMIESNVMGISTYIYASAIFVNRLFVDYDGTLQLSATDDFIKQVLPLVNGIQGNMRCLKCGKPKPQDTMHAPVKNIRSQRTAPPSDEKDE
jgi:hypothetical protein